MLLERKRFDWAFLPVVCWSKALVFLLRFIVLSHVRQFQSAGALLKAHYLLQRSHSSDAPTSRLQRAIEGAIGRELSREGSAHFNLTRGGKVSEQDLRFLKKLGGIVLKAPRFVGDRVVEKGALLLKFNRPFHTFRHCVDVVSVLQHYVLILEPGWSGYANFNILYFTRFTDHPIIVMSPEKRDYQFLERLGTNLIPVSFGPGDWVNPSIFRPLEGQEKLYDAVMVARWALFKRHHVLFRALRDLRDPSFQVALVGLPPPGDQKEVDLLIDAYGVGDNVSLFGWLSQEEVNKILNQSKVNILLSLQEGGNRCLFEGFFAGVPGLALKNNVGIPKDYFTPQTGKLISEIDLGRELLYFREHWHEFDPRTWAEANIAPQVTTSKLNCLLKDLAVRRGEEWTQDIAAKCNCPNLKYYPDEEVVRELPSMEEILVQYARSKEISGLIVGKFQLEAGLSIPSCQREKEQERVS